ncbi:MAG: ribbon-helix-helix protein, CopG family [bacterium]|nr:ribbon-helix-helix protein, CopG family [bacterium]
MHRTQILLDQELKKVLSRYSRARSTSVSEIIRSVLRLHFKHMNQTQMGLGGLRRLVAMAEKKGPRDLSAKIDEILYRL